MYLKGQTNGEKYDQAFLKQGVKFQVADFKMRK